MQKQVPMTISYLMPLVTKIYIFLGDDEVVPSIDPAKVCQGSRLRAFIKKTTWNLWATNKF